MIVDKAMCYEYRGGKHEKEIVQEKISDRKSEPEKQIFHCSFQLLFLVASENFN